jgi:hypothetical protein
MLQWNGVLGFIMKTTNQSLGHDLQNKYSIFMLANAKGKRVKVCPNTLNNIGTPSWRSLDYPGMPAKITPKAQQPANSQRWH